MSRSGRRALFRRLPLYRRRPLVISVVMALIIAIRVWQDLSRPVPPETLPEGTYTVQRVVDGDTLLLANGARLRLIGADTPETVKPGHPVEPFGPEATQFTQQFLDEADGRIRLQLDRERLDKYGRFLGYVWVADRMLNEELIRAGLATAETGYRYSSSMKTRFRRTEEEAKAAERGIWSR
jgi:micrococcal nuclease